MIQQYTSFRGVPSYGSSMLSEELESNLISFLDWSFLGINGFTTVNSGLAPSYGGSPNRLRMVDDPNYTSGKVWQTYRKNLVYETGTEGTAQPINISGVYINGVLRTRNNLVNPFHINYKDGQVIFSGALPTGTIVEMNYSFKNVWIDSNDSLVSQEIQYNSTHPEDPHFSSSSSGSWYPIAMSRVQLPAIGIEVIPARSFKPYQLGGGQWIENKVLFHVFTENDADCNRLIDIISYQSDLRFFLYNSNWIAQSGAFPLDASGDRVANPLMYPALVEMSGVGFRWRQTQFNNMQVADKIKFNQNLYGAILSSTIHTDFQEL